MDTRIVEARKNITIMFLINLNGNFTYNINTVEFIPDEVNVKCINYASNNINVEDGLLSLIYTDLVSDYIGSFYIYSNPNQHHSFTLKRPVKGKYNLTLLDINGGIDNLREGQLAIHFEFVKYKDVKPQQIY